MTRPNPSDKDRLLQELQILEQRLDAIPSKFGLANGISSRKLKYDYGKLRFDSWLKNFLDWLDTNIPDSEKEIAELTYTYDDSNCTPSGSGYGTPRQMVNSVFIEPFRNRIDSIREDIDSGDFFKKYSFTKTREHPWEHFVAKERIDDLRATTCCFDLSKLVALLEEVNKANSTQSVFCIGLLVRAVLDHVPPIFSSGGFGEVANNYQGTRSFRQAMAGLETQMRKISDSFLHTHIRASESLPTFQQVDVRNSFDLLLAEIIIITRSAHPARAGNRGQTPLL